MTAPALARLIVAGPHGRAVKRVAERYATTAEARAAILRAAHETFVIDRAFRGALAEAMVDLP